jgi:hypothetical protein
MTKRRGKPSRNPRPVGALESFCRDFNRACGTGSSLPGNPATEVAGYFRPFPLTRRLKAIHYKLSHRNS